MKFKPIYASMLVLGLVSGPVLAQSGGPVVQSEVDLMRAKVAKMEAVIQKNQTGGFQQPCDWYQRIQISGQANVDGFYSNKTPTSFQNNEASAINLTNANIFVDALASDWTRFHGSILYQDTQQSFIFRPTTTNFTLDEGYVTIGNFARSPFYFRAGRQYVDFGDYQRFPMIESFTQLMTETQATAATVGFVHPIGFNASVFAFDGMPKNTDPVVSGGTQQRSRIRNYGASAGFANGFCLGRPVNYKIGVSYLYNMADVNYINTSAGLADGSGYLSRVQGLAGALDLATGPFDAKLRYVHALNDFDTTDLSFDGARAEPSAFDINAGLSFLTMCHQSRLGIGWGTTSQASDVGDRGLPKQRYEADYMVNFSRWTDVGVGVYHDIDYGDSSGGTGRNATTGVLRLAVRFA